MDTSVDHAPKKRKQVHWPPPCEYGACENPAESGLVEINFGTYRAPVRLCVEHREQLGRV